MDSGRARVDAHSRREPALSGCAARVSRVNSSDPYGRNIFAHDPHRDGPGARRPRSQAVHVEIGMVLEDVASGWVGAVTRVEKSGGVHLVELEDRRGMRRSFPLGPGFWLEGRPIEALPPRPATVRASSGTQVNASGRRITNSGSFAPASSGPKVAKRSRIWVEGRHDAELVQHVWGEDLAEAGIAVQLLEGVDNLEAILEIFGPTDTARAGVLVDHMVPGSKESRIAEAVSARWPGAVLVLGHPFVDIWQAVKPQVLGIPVWPQVPRGEDWKKGILRRLGQPHQNQEDVANAWKRILSRVDSYSDLDPTLLGPVESLIDFLTE